jgi:hypothetical protein
LAGAESHDQDKGEEQHVRMVRLKIIISTGSQGRGEPVKWKEQILMEHPETTHVNTLASDTFHNAKPQDGAMPKQFKSEP